MKLKRDTLAEKIAQIIWESHKKWGHLIAAEDEFNICKKIAHSIIRMVIKARKEGEG